jgi:hypothetical protein
MPPIEATNGCEVSRCNTRANGLERSGGGSAVGSAGKEDVGAMTGPTISCSEYRISWLEW